MVLCQVNSLRLLLAGIKSRPSFSYPLTFLFIREAFWHHFCIAGSLSAPVGHRSRWRLTPRTLPYPTIASSPSRSPASPLLYPVGLFLRELRRRRARRPLLYPGRKREAPAPSSTTPGFGHAEPAAGLPEVLRVFPCSAAGAAGCAAGPSVAGLGKLAGLSAPSSCRASSAGLGFGGA